MSATMLENQLKALEQRGLLPILHKLLEHIAVADAAGDVETLELINEILEVSRNIGDKALKKRQRIMGN